MTFWRVVGGVQMQVLTKYEAPEALTDAVLVDGSLSDHRNDIAYAFLLIYLLSMLQSTHDSI